MKKILIVGSDQLWSLERIYLKYLREAGVPAELFPAQSIFYTYYQAGLINKLLFKSRLSGIYKSINRQLLHKVSEYKPAIIWVFKGMEILPETLQMLRRQGYVLANYNPDNPFLFSGAGSGNRNVSGSLHFFDLHFTYSLAIKKELESLGLHTSLLPFGFDIAGQVYEQSRQQKEVLKTCFLGNPDRHRATFLRQLADLGIAIDVYGHNWAKFIEHPSVNIFDAVYDTECWMVLARYRVQLNLMRPHNLDSHNMRSFEIPAIGGIQVAPDTPEHRLYFTPGKEIFLFESPQQGAAIINSLLNLSYEEAVKVRQEARQKSLQGHYSYLDRAMHANAILQRLAQTKKP